MGIHQGSVPACSILLEDAGMPTRLAHTVTHLKSLGRDTLPRQVTVNALGLLNQGHTAPLIS
eukprot:1150273-Pelagomonas_calceolata.AAC.4